MSRKHQVVHWEPQFLVTKHREAQPGKNTGLPAPPGPGQRVTAPGLEAALAAGGNLLEQSGAS